jgi:3-oxoadipate enol-lactonase
MITINYEDKGHGFPVVLIHGLSDDLRFWDPVVAELSKDYRTIAFDLRGHGKSDKPEDSYSIEQFSQDIYRVLLEIGIKEAHFIGFSMGSAILQQLVLDNPQMVKSMILMSSFSYIDSYLKDKFVILRKCLVQDGFTAFFDEVLPLVLTSQFIEGNKDAIRDMKEEKIKTESDDALISSIDACLEFNLKEEISSISSPVLIISGKEDRFTRRILAEQIHKSIKNSKFEIIENTSHNVIIPENIHLMREIINKFFK